MTAPLRVVVIDDEDETRNLMSLYLSAHLPASVRVHAVGDVGYREGIRWDQVAVAIVDVMMPVVDGRDILRWLRDERPDIYRICWSAYAQGVRDEVTSEGLAHTVVTKPGLEELVRLVRAEVT